MKKSIRNLLSLVIILAMSLTLLAGCSSDKAQETVVGAEIKSEGPSGKLMIYTSIYPDIIEQVKPELKKAFPNLEVEWFQGGTEKVVAKLSGEIEAKKVQADMLMVADPSYYLTLKDKDLLLQYASPNRNEALSKDEEGYWTGVRISNMIIAYNSDKVKEPPKTFKELTDAKWKGKLAMPSPLLSGTAFVTAAALSDKYGWEYFENLKNNGITVEEGNTAVQNKLITGEYEVAMILEENILKLADKGEPLKVVYPEDGVIVIPSPIAIFKSSSNPEAAKAIEDWWLSKEGQEVIVKGWMHSVRPDVNPPKGAEALNSFIGNSVKVDWDKLSKNNAEYKENFRAKVME